MVPHSEQESKHSMCQKHAWLYCQRLLREHIILSGMTNFCKCLYFIIYTIFTSSVSVSTVLLSFLLFPNTLTPSYNIFDWSIPLTFCIYTLFSHMKPQSPSQQSLLPLSVTLLHSCWRLSCCRIFYRKWIIALNKQSWVIMFQIMFCRTSTSLPSFICCCCTAWCWRCFFFSFFFHDPVVSSTADFLEANRHFRFETHRVKYLLFSACPDENSENAVADIYTHTVHLCSNFV